MKIRGGMVLVGIALECALAQTQPAAYPSSGPVIRTESRLVLVDTVVTDKKGKYVRDLTAKDFRVWEDNKEQAIKSFSFEAEATAPAGKRARYLVLFFDNSTISLPNQVYARRAAVKFIEANAGPDRLMAVVNFGGTLQVTQNFTAGVERLKQAASGVRFSSVNPNAEVEVASIGAPSLARSASAFGVRSVLLALRMLAKDLAAIPGRKSLIFLTEGFPLGDDDRPELTAVIDACNKANVAVYPIDVRGLVAPAVGASSGFSGTVNSFLRLASFTPSTSLAFWQRPGGGGTTGGGTTGGGTTSPGSGSRGGVVGGVTTRPGGVGTGNPGSLSGGGGRGGSIGSGGGIAGGGTTGGRYGGSSVNQNTLGNNASRQPRVIVPTFPPSSSANQDVMFALAAGTGGFVIANTNGLLEGLQKIGNEQNEYYMVSYTPAESTEGSCHTLKVKVDRPGVTVRARSGYCNTKPVDALAGKPMEKELEALVAGSAPGSTTASISLPYFYTSANTARVSVAMEIPGNAFNFEKVKGKQHSEMNLLGIASKPDGSLAARFSDTVKLDFENKKEVEEFHGKPFHYENQFEIAAGQYTLKVGFSSGRQSVGKVAAPLAVDPFDARQLAISALAVGKKIVRVNQIGMGMDAALLEDRTPLVVRGLQITPSGSSRFKTTDPAVLYLELYEPLLSGQNPPTIGLQVRVVDRKTGTVVQDTGLVSVEDHIMAGHPVVPIGLRLFALPLGAGSYRTEVSAKDSAGRSTAIRSVDYELE